MHREIHCQVHSSRQRRCRQHSALTATYALSNPLVHIVLAEKLLVVLIDWQDCVALPDVVIQLLHLGLHLQQPHNQSDVVLQLLHWALNLQPKIHSEVATWGATDISKAVQCCNTAMMEQNQELLAGTIRRHEQHSQKALADRPGASLL